jgi:hypothetical protein
VDKDLVPDVPVWGRQGCPLNRCVLNRSSQHLTDSSTRRCSIGTVLGRGQRDDLGHAGGGRARQAHRQASWEAQLVSPAVHRKPWWNPDRVERQQSELRLSLREREEISRGLAAGLSIRAIAEGLRRSPSTVCREVNANGGRAKYRALQADRGAEQRALRPKPAKLSQCRRLRSRRTQARGALVSRADLFVVG